MGLIFDTSVIIGLERASSRIEGLIKGRELEPFGISVVTLFELLHGVYKADSEPSRRQREAFVEKIIELFPIYPFALNEARIYARIWAQLIKKGVVVGAHDLMIASTCLSLEFSVLTANIRDYKKIEGLSVEEFPAG